MTIHKAKDLSDLLFDIVIVGGGIAGAIIAKELSIKGNNVLILEAGEGEDMNFFKYQENVDTYLSASIKSPNSPYKFNDNAPQPDELDVISRVPSDNSRGYFIQKGPLPYRSDYTKILGGTTLHWLGTCLRMIPNDFNVKSLYGIGLDWPLNYNDLIEYYEKAELEIGVSGNADEQRTLGKLLNIEETWFREDYCFPMHNIPQSFLDKYIAKGLSEKHYTLYGNKYPYVVTSTPQGRNGVPNENYRINNKTYVPAGAVGNPYQGHRCQGFSSCVPICPIQAKYNALKTLEKAVNTGNVTINTQSVASRVLYNTEGNVQAIEYKAYNNKNKSDFKVYKARGKVFILAANAIENTKLMLNSNMNNPLLGKYLMDHPFLLTWGLSRDSLGNFRGPGSTSGIETFRDGDFRKIHSPFRIEISNLGWSWAKGTPMSLIKDLVGKGIYGQKLRRILYNHSQRQIQLGFLLDQPPNINNCITINKNKVDQLSIPRPIINYNISEYTLKGMEKAKMISEDIFKNIKIEDHSYYNEHDPGYIEINNKGYVFNPAGHFLGGHIMGTNQNNSVVNKYQKVWGYDNCYAVGCGSLPTSGTANPTLTLAALSYLTVDDICRNMKSKGR